MKKWLLSLTVALLCVVCLAAEPAHAATVDSDKWGDDIIWTLDDAGTLTISGTGEMWDNETAPFNANHWHSGRVKKLVVEEGVTAIGADAFSYTNTLTSVSLPNSLKKIGGSAFESCENLTSIVIPDSVTTIGEAAFRGCDALTDVRLPKNLTSIGTRLFSGCYNLTSIHIPEKVTIIGSNAFSDCQRLQSVKIPNAVTVIEKEAFSFCYGLKEVVIGSGVKSIGEYAFQECAGLEKLTIPGNVKTIADDAFTYCTGLTSVTFEYGVTEVGKRAFNECTSLEYIELPDSITSVGSDAFACCSSLQAAVFSGGCDEISSAVFAYCTKLQLVVIPRSIKNIGSSAFSNCPSLTAVYYLGDVEDLNSLYVESGNDALLYANVYLAMIASKSPSDVTTSVGGKSATFTAEASHPKAKYQWLYLAPGSDEWAEVTDLTGRTGKTLTVPSKAKYDGYQFACYMYRDEGDYGVREAISDPATMTVVPGPTNIYRLSDVVVANGKTATVTVEATGTGLTYEWYYANPGSTTFRKSSTTGKTYSLTMNSERDGRRIYCKITDKYGASVKTSTFTLHMGELGVPQASLTTKASSGKPALSWKAAKNATKYEVWRAESKNGPYRRVLTTANLSYTNTGAEAGKTYYYKVRSINADGCVSSYSSVKSITCDLAQPTNLKVATKADTGKPYLTWDAVDGADRYEIWRATSKTGTYTKAYTTTKTSYNNTGAVAGKTYYYKVRAVMDESSYASSAYSAVKSITCDLPAPVTSLSNNKTSGKPYLTWKAVDGAVKYEVYRATSKDGTYSKMLTTTKTSYTNTSAVAGTTYYYKVRAIAENSYANSGYSTIKSITCDLAQPTGVTITLNSGGKPRIAWDKVTGAEKYEVYRATSENGTYTKMYTTTNLSYTNTSAVAGTTYYYKVRAIIPNNSYATGAYSAVVSITAK